MHMSAYGADLDLAQQGSGPGMRLLPKNKFVRSFIWDQLHKDFKSNCGMNRPCKPPEEPALAIVGAMVGCLVREVGCHSSCEGPTMIVYK